VSVTRMQPPISEPAVPFWDATRDKQLTYQWCPSCQRHVWYPREFCPGCLGTELEWRTASGRGVVYACSTMPKPMHPGMKELVPYVVALVDLAEGPRLMTNVTGCAPEDVRVGLPVQVTWEPLEDGRHLPLFEPAKEA
jgi:uncharacterized OB-fold protein